MKKKVKKIKWLDSKKIPLALIATVICVFGMVWGLDNHWLPREIHNIAMAQVGKTLESIQKELASQSAQNQEFYWQRKEAELKSELRKRPNDPMLLQEYKEVLEERRRCQDQMKELQKR